MSQLTISQTDQMETTQSDWQNLCKLGGIVAWVQLACILFTFVVMTIVGGEPTTANEYYTSLQNDGLAGLLRFDFTTLILLALFPFIAIAIYAAFRNSKPAYGLLAMLLILMGTGLGLANHSAFSIMHLNELHTNATPAQQVELLTAGEAIIASDMWNSTAGFLAGIFMQGGFVFISFVMLQSNLFSKATAYSGIFANGFDLIHVFVMLFAPSLAMILLAIGGVFYLVWFPLLGRDLYRLGKSESHE